MLPKKPDGVAQLRATRSPLDSNFLSPEMQAKLVVTHGVFGGVFENFNETFEQLDPVFSAVARSAL